MYYISDYRKKAVTKITPYLIDFNDIVKLIECNSDRYQAIEDLLWKVANNLKVDNARGVFLQALAHNEATNVIYTDMAQDAFTYGTDEPLYQAYGTGHYYSQASYISGIKKDISDEKLIRTVKAKIIQNNTNCTVEDLIEGLKLYYNADHVYVYESNPLQVSIFLVGKNLEISSSQNKEIIKAFLPACVKLNEIFVDTQAFEIFKYNNTPSYGNSRYPTVVRETVDLYSYHSKSISLNSEYEEYIKTNHTSFADNMFTTICFSTQESVTEGVILSSYNTDGTDGFEIGIGLNADSKNVFYLKYKENINYTEVEVEANKNYTLLLLNKNNELKIWCLNNIGLQGNDIEYEKSYINKVLLNTTPNTSVLDFVTPETPIYINCSYYNETLSSLSNLTYHVICFGLYEDSVLLTEYYPTCYGEKQILFNCIENNNHLKINTTKTLDKDITVRQSVYNYKLEHSNGIYAYFDGKSGLDYNINTNEPTQESVKLIDISFDVCVPFSFTEGSIISGFVPSETAISKIYLTQEGKMSFELPVNIMEEDMPTETSVTTSTQQPVIQKNEYANFNVKIEDNTIFVYKNNEILEILFFEGYLFSLPNLVKVGYHSGAYFNGILRNLKAFVSLVNSDDVTKIELPLTSELYNEKLLNNGVRFITVPQLISNKKNTDIYNNNTTR